MVGDTIVALSPVYIVECEVEAVAYDTSGAVDVTYHCVTFGATHILLEAVGRGVIEDVPCVEGAEHYAYKP